MATNPTVTHFPIPPTSQAPVMQGRPLARKLTQVLSEVHRVPKNGRNDFHKYDYVYEADLVDHIRDKLADQGIALFPSVKDHHTKEMQDARGRTAYLTTVSLDVTLIDGDSGDSMTTTWVGQGMDNSDKGYYKAYTGALKYFILKTFLISTGDDPENDDQVHEGPMHPAQGREQAVQDGPRLSEDDKLKARVIEFHALLDEAVAPEMRNAFKALYVKRMGAKKIEEISAQKIGAMCRRLRGKSADARRTYIEGVMHDHTEAGAEEE